MTEPAAGQPVEPVHLENLRFSRVASTRDRLVRSDWYFIHGLLARGLDENAAGKSLVSGVVIRMFGIRRRPPVPQRGAVIFALQVLLVVLIPVLDDGQDLTSPAYAAAFIAVAVYSVLLLGYRSTAATLAVGGVAAIVWTLLVAGESPLLRLPLLFVLITGALVASALCIKASFSLRVPSMQRIFCGAASYVMLGFVFAGIHGINYQLFHAGYDILNGAGQTSHLRWVHFLWLSFATLTTAGFGDVAPTSSTACAIATLEGLCGILFPSTLIARIASISAEDRSE